MISISDVINLKVNGRAPNVTSFDKEVCVEWWVGPRKVTLYLDDKTAEVLLVWGPDIDHDMVSRRFCDLSELEPMFEWLVQGGKPPIPADPV